MKLIVFSLLIAGRASYLSANICDEFIDIIGKKVFAVILAELKAAKYFAMSVDSSPDVSHTDQLSFCLRYVLNILPVERFLRFIPIQRHTSEYLCHIVMEFLKKYGISLSDCRGQSYDNAYNMAGLYSGLQTRILDENNLAKFFPCAAHSLCLVGKNAVSKNKKAVQFFNFVENLYLFFVRSPYRWEKLKDVLTGKEVVLKKATGTRWSAKYSAINSLCLAYPKVKNILIFLMSDDCPQSDDQKITAESLLKMLCKFETVFILKLWDKILHKFDKVNISLQKIGLDLSVTVKLFTSLILFLESLKTEFDTMFNECETYFNEHVSSDTSLIEILQSGTKTRSDGNSANASQDKEAYRNNIFLPIVTSLLSELEMRKKNLR